MVPGDPASPRLRVAFVLAPRFTLTAFAGFVDALRLAADEGDRSRPRLIRWEVLGSEPVRASCGAAVQPTAPLANAAVKLKAEDFRLVHPVADAVMVFVTRKDLGVNSVDELIALARKSADRPLTYGSVGIGSLYHLILEQAQAQTGIKLAHVPYKGNAPLLQDIAGGQVDFAVLVYSAGMGALADQGRLKVIGQLGAQRSDLLKNVPTVSEGQSLKNFSYKIWTGFMVPRNTPEDVVVKLHAAIGRTLQDPAVRSQLAAQTQHPSAPMTLAESARFVEAETARYRAIAKQINLQPQ